MKLPAALLAAFGIAISSLAIDPPAPPAVTLEWLRSTALAAYAQTGNTLTAQQKELQEQQKKLSSQLSAAKLRDKARADAIAGELVVIKSKLAELTPKIDEMTDFYKRAKTDNIALLTVLLSLDLASGNDNLKAVMPFRRYRFSQVVDDHSILANGVKIGWVEIGGASQVGGYDTLVHLAGLDDARALAEGSILDGVIVTPAGVYEYRTVLGATKSVPSYKIAFRLQ